MAEAFPGSDRQSGCVLHSLVPSARFRNGLQKILHSSAFAFLVRIEEEVPECILTDMKTSSV